MGWKKGNGSDWDGREGRIFSKVGSPARRNYRMEWTSKTIVPTRGI